MTGQLTAVASVSRYRHLDRQRTQTRRRIFGIREKLLLQTGTLHYGNPLDTTKLSDRIVSVVTGQITNHASVNPDKTL